MLKLVLASGSKQRKEIFDYMGLEYQMVKSSIEEVTNAIDPDKYVMEISKNKANNVKKQLNDNNIIVACDTIIYMDGKSMKNQKQKKKPIIIF